MAEILAIMKRNDIAGICVLYDTPKEAIVNSDGVHVSGLSEYLFHINTSYTIARMEGGQLKIRGKAIHYPSKEVRDISLAKTYNMITLLKDVTMKMAMQAGQMHGLIKRMVDARDDPGTFTTHTQQNN